MKKGIFFIFVLMIIASGCKLRNESYDSYENALSIFSEGRLAEDEKKYIDATNSYHNVLNIIDNLNKLGDEKIRLHGNAQYRLGVVFRSQAMYDDALKMDKTAYKDYILIGDSIRMMHATRNIAREFSALKQYDSCKYYFDKSLIMSELTKRHNDKISILGEIGSQYYRKIGDYPNAIKYIELSESLWEDTEDKNKEFYSSVNHVILSYLYYITKDYEKAKQEAVKGLENEKVENRVTCYQILYEISKESDNCEKTLEYADAFISNLTENFTQDKNQSIQKLQTEFQLQRQKEELLQAEKSKRFRIITLILIILVVSILIAFFFSRKALKNKLELEETKNDLLRNKQRINELMENLNHLVEENKTISAATNDIHQKEQYIQENWLASNRVFKLAKNIENHENTSKYLLEENDWEDFTKVSNVIFDNFVDKITVSHKELLKWDIRTLCLLRHGFSQDTIAFLLNIQTQSLRKRLYRMKYEKLEDARSLEELINEEKGTR